MEAFAVRTYVRHSSAATAVAAGTTTTTAAEAAAAAAASIAGQGKKKGRRTDMESLAAAGAAYLFLAALWFWPPFIRVLSFFLFDYYYTSITTKPFLLLDQERAIVEKGSPS